MAGREDSVVAKGALVPNKSVVANRTVVARAREWQSAQKQKIHFFLFDRGNLV